MLPGQRHINPAPFPPRTGQRTFIKVLHEGEECPGWYQNGCFWFYSGITVLGVKVGPSNSHSGILEKEVLEKGEEEQEWEWWWCYWGQWEDQWPCGTGFDWEWHVEGRWCAIESVD